MHAISAIIVAGGKGSRMGAELPKQFLPLVPDCILMHSIRTFAQHPQVKEIIVVLPADALKTWDALCEKYAFKIEHQCLAGGSERFYSVQAGLQLAKQSHVAIHDGVRPFVSQATLDRCFKTLDVSKAVVPVVASKESVRLVSDQSSQALNRDDVRLVQTPQCFERQSLIEAFKHGYQNFFTDDASVYEQRGGHITLVEGNEENIKITSPYDLAIAQHILNPHKA